MVAFFASQVFDMWALYEHTGRLQVEPAVACLSSRVPSLSHGPAAFYRRTMDHGCL